MLEKLLQHRALFKKIRYLGNSSPRILSTVLETCLVYLYLETCFYVLEACPVLNTN